MNVLLVVYTQIFLDLGLQIKKCIFINLYKPLTGELTWLIDFVLEHSYYSKQIKTPKPLTVC